MKTCSICAEDLPSDRFHKCGRGRRRPECKSCFKAKRPRFGTPGAGASISKADYQRFYKYGITGDEFRALLDRQAGRCAICDSANPGSPDWNVDHCHKTGRVRGLLCRPCNIALGLLEDDGARLARAIDYLNGVAADGRL